MTPPVVWVKVTGQIVVDSCTTTVVYAVVARLVAGVVAYEETGAVPTDVPMMDDAWEDGADSEETGQAVWPERTTPEETHGAEVAAVLDEAGAVPTDVPMMDDT